MAENPICLDYEMLAGGLSLLSDKARFPFIPHALATYAAACARSGRDNRLTAAVKGKRVKVFDQINLMFQLASAATTLDPEELLRRTDFDFRDISLTRLDSAFAEVRSIIFLNQQGFTNIRPIPAANRKGADISAVLNARAFAAEVANSIYCAEKRVEPVQLKDWLIGRVLADQKLRQLKETARELGAAALLLIGVIDTSDAVTFNTHDDFVAAAQLAWEELGKEPNLHIALVTGRAATGYGPDDAVYPAWGCEQSAALHTACDPN